MGTLLLTRSHTAAHTGAPLFSVYSNWGFSSFLLFIELFIEANTLKYNPEFMLVVFLHILKVHL